MYLFEGISYCFIPSILLKLVVYVFKLVFLMLSYSLDNITTSMRRRHLDSTFFVFSKRVILKRENNTLNIGFSVTYNLDLCNTITI